MTDAPNQSSNVTPCLADGLVGEDHMTRIERWNRPLWWAVTVFCLLGSVAGVSAQRGPWETATRAGVQAFDQGHYAEAAQQFQAALTMAETFMPDDPRLPTSLMNLAAVSRTQGQYTRAATLYQRTLLLQEQLLGPADPQLVDVLQAYADLDRQMHPVRSRLPWSLANRLATRARRIQDREESAGILDAPGTWADLFRPSE